MQSTASDELCDRLAMEQQVPIWAYHHICGISHMHLVLMLRIKRFEQIIQYRSHSSANKASVPSAFSSCDNVESEQGQHDAYQAKRDASPQSQREILVIFLQHKAIPLRQEMGRI